MTSHSTTREQPQSETEAAVPLFDNQLFTFTRLPLGQWRSARTTNTIERLHEEFIRRIKTQTVLPSADTAAMLFWALLASGQISMRKVDGWRLNANRQLDSFTSPEITPRKIPTTFRATPRDVSQLLSCIAREVVLIV